MKKKKRLLKENLKKLVKQCLTKYLKFKLMQ